MSTSEGEMTERGTKYATARIVILGDPGVGKTVLGYKLALGNSADVTTPPQHSWVVRDFSTRLPDGTQCEAVLWDLVRKPAYQAIYPIFLDDVDAALLLFDPTNRRNTLAGVKFWLEQLSHNAELPPCILVGTRVDRGGLAVSEDDILSFCESHGVVGGYVPTSASTGEGLDVLRENLRALISWDALRVTAEAGALNPVRRKVLELKETAGAGDRLVDLTELRAKIQESENVLISEPELLASAKLIRKHGHVEVLPGSSGEFFVLLEPELLMDTASAVVNLAERDLRGLGALSETRLLSGDIPLPELEALDKPRQSLLVEHVLARLIDREICFRERYGLENLLVFPGLIRQKRPPQDSALVEDTTYFVEGKVKNVYTALVVLLGYTNSLKRFNLWQNQVQYEYEDQPHQICGFKLEEEQEGYIELVLQYENTPEDKRPSFQHLFEFFLSQREVAVRRLPPVFCLNGHPQARVAIITRLREGKPSAFCIECGEKFDLPGEEILRPEERPLPPWLQHEKDMVELRKMYETYLVNVTGFWQQETKPRCHLSHTVDDDRLAEKLAQDLSLAGIEVVKDRSVVPGRDHLVMVESDSYKRQWVAPGASFEGEKSFIQDWISRKGRLHPINVEPDANSALPHDFGGCRPGDFSDDTHYPVSLFDLVMDLYNVPRKQPGFVRRQRELHEQWERTLARKKADGVSPSLKVFISYSDEDEEFKDELLTMLAGLQQRKVVDAWEHRRIEEGDEWYRATQDAMSSCDLAILLVSQHFIASRLVQDNELPGLLQRRREESLRVIPIIVRHCLWESEPVLSGLQPLPRDGRAVNTFPKDNGERDKVWAGIAAVIEERAKAKTTA